MCGMAEALQFVLVVIATDYGGNTDFCDGPLSHLIRCKEVPIPRGTYPCADGHFWGEPDLAHAAQLMQEVATRRSSLMDHSDGNFSIINSNDEILAAYRDRFSFLTVGKRYESRLSQLWDE